MEKTYNLVEFFSGIGSQAKALKNLGINVNVHATSEWDVHALAAYDVIHNSPEIPLEIQNMNKEEILAILQNYSFSNSGKEPLKFNSLKTYTTEVLKRIYTSILRNKNFVDITKIDGKSMSDSIDILTYSFPCQDLSNVGAFHGYNKGIDKNSGSRSSLLWQVGRILMEMKEVKKKLPRFLLMENVPTLLSKRHFDNFQKWIEELESLGYISQYYQLNASSFGLPQNRPRLLMISVYVGEDTQKWKLVHDYFDKKKDPEIVVSDYQKSNYYKQYTVEELLRTNYANKKIFAEAIECTPNDTESRRRIWNENPQIILPNGTFNPDVDAIRTITTKQDRNPNSGNLFFDSGIEGRSKFRYLTPRECLLFMGFEDKDYRQLKNNNVEFHSGDLLFSRDKIIRMAGNSIPVKLLEGIFFQIMQIDQMMDEYQCKDMFVDLNTYDYGKMIRSYVFKSGIRSRIKSNDVYPRNATIVYPKYKTAVYVEECPVNIQNVETKGCDLCQYRYWQNRCPKMHSSDEQACEEIVNMGWSVISINICDLSLEKQKDTLEWIVQCIRNGLCEDNQGKVYCCG